MKKTANFFTLTGYMMILTSAGLSDTAADITQVIKLLLCGILMIALSRFIAYVVKISDFEKRVRRNRQWRRIQTREQSYYTF